MKNESNKNKPEIYFPGDYLELHNIICLCYLQLNV